jgi:hypothetical protein
MFQEVNLILIGREKERGFVEQCCQWQKLYSINGSWRNMYGMVLMGKIQSIWRRRNCFSTIGFKSY